MEMIKRIVIASLLVGISLHASDAQPTSKRDWRQLLDSAVIMGGGYGFWKHHKAAEKQYSDNILNWVLLSSKAKIRPVAPSLYNPIISGVMMGYGLSTLYRWYDSNLRAANNYYPNKKKQ